MKSHKAPVKLVPLVEGQPTPIHSRGPFSLLPTALIATRTPTWKESEEAYNFLRASHGATLWWIGDLLNLMEGTFHERYAQLIDPTDYAVETVRRAQQVANRVPIILRHPAIAWGVFETVAPLEATKQRAILVKVLEDKLRISDVREIVRGKVKSSPDPVPVRALTLASSIPQDFGDLIRELPLKKWDDQSIALVRDAFEKSVKETRDLLGIGVAK